MESVNKNKINLDFVRQDGLADQLRSILSKENEKRSESVLDGSFDPACLTECPRRLFYKSTSLNCKEQYFTECSQSSIRNKWISYFEKCSRIRIAKSNVIASDCDYNISGYADAVIEMGDYLTVVKIKGVTESIYEKIKIKSARKKDVIETMVYSWLLEIPHGILIYENLNNQDYTIFHIIPYKPIIESIKNKCLKLFHMKHTMVIPEKPYASKMSKECRVCLFNNKCW